MRNRDYETLEKRGKSAIEKFGEGIENRLKYELTERGISIENPKQKLNIERYTLDRILFELELPTLDDINCNLNFPPTYQGLVNYAKQNKDYKANIIKNLAESEQTCFSIS